MSMSRLALLAAAGLVTSSAFAAVKPVTRTALKEWTFLVYINADNNLDENGVDDMNEMESVGSTDQLNIVTQLDREGAGGTWRYLVHKDSNMAEITSPVLETMPEQDMGSPDTLQAFIQWGMEKYPAKKTAVIIWNHGSGWEKKQNRFGTKGVSYDDDSGNHLSVVQVGAVLKELSAKRGQKFEIIGYDACLMQMAEVAAEAVGSAKFQVASEETEPLDGWPYDKVFEGIAANPTWNGAEAGKHIVHAYGESYNGGSQGDSDTTQSCIDLERFAEFKTAADAYVAALQSNAAHTAPVNEAIGASQSYAEPDHKDMVDFIDQVSSRITDQAVIEAGNALKAALTDKVIVASHLTGSSLEASKGLAVWLPSYVSQSLMSSYKQLAWSAGTQWDELVTVLTAAGNGGGGGGDEGDEGDEDDGKVATSVRAQVRQFRGTQLDAKR